MLVKRETVTEIREIRLILIWEEQMCPLNLLNTAPDIFVPHTAPHIESEAREIRIATLKNYKTWL